MTDTDPVDDDEVAEAADEAVEEAEAGPDPEPVTPPRPAAPGRVAPPPATSTAELAERRAAAGLQVFTVSGSGQEADPFAGAYLAAMQQLAVFENELAVTALYLTDQAHRHLLHWVEAAPPVALRADLSAVMSARSPACVWRL